MVIVGCYVGPVEKVETGSGGAEEQDELRLLFPPSLGRIRASARAEVLSDSLGQRIGRRVVVDVAKSYADLEASVLAKTTDLAWAPPSICAKAEPFAAAIFKAVRFGESSYNSAFVGRANSSLCLGSLQGMRAAWVDPLSSAGHLLPISHLTELGLDPGAVFSSQEFLGSYQGALLAVLSGKADVASIYCHGKTHEAARKTMVENVGASELHLAPFAFTEAAPSDGLIVADTAKVNDALIDAVERAVNGARGPTLLLELFEADRLERSSPCAYAHLRAALVSSSSGPADVGLTLSHS